MGKFVQKYKAILLVAFLGLFISSVDRYILSGRFQGIDNYKHIIYILCLVAGLIVVLSILLKGETRSK